MALNQSSSNHFSGPLDQQQVGSTSTKLKLPLQLDVVVLIVVVGVEWFGLTGSLQILSQLPGLKGRFDLGDEGWEFRPKLGMVIGCFNEVQELLTDEVVESFGNTKVGFDASGCPALLDPDFVKESHALATG